MGKAQDIREAAEDELGRDRRPDAGGKLLGQVSVGFPRRSGQTGFLLDEPFGDG
jgi:hypothetical protein